MSRAASPLIGGCPEPPLLLLIGGCPEPPLPEPPLTALVDFTKLAEHAHEQGFSIDLYTTQAHFLIALGVADQLGTESAHQQIKSAQEIRRLTHPLEMGERF